MAKLKLSLNELKLILPEINSICDKWYHIGLALDLPVDYLEDLDTQLSDDKIDVGSCLRKVLVEWIKSDQATWPILIKVLSSDLVKGKRVASVLQRKYGGSSPVTNKKTGTSCTKIKRSAPKVGEITKRKRVGSSSKRGKIERSKYVKLPDTFSPEDFSTSPTTDRLCVKCRRIPSVPLRSICCDQLYCGSCSQKDKKCRKHRKLNHYTIDKELKKALSKLIRKCPNQSSGCTWKGHGWQLRGHLSEKCLKTGNSAKPEVSSTNDSTTASAMLAPYSEEVFVIEDMPTTDKQNNTHDQLQETPIHVRSKQETPTPVQSKQETPMRVRSKQETPTRVQSNLETPICVQSSLETPICVHTSKPSLQANGSCNMLRAPPLNLAMENVSDYIDSEDAWLSDSFLSHQIGYRICLAVRIGSSSGNSGMLNVMLGIAPADGPHGSYLVYPCTGFATIAIMNPVEDCDHHVLELMFTLEESSYHEIAGEAVQIPQYFITHVNSLFFRVEKIDLDKTKYKLWLLDPFVAENSEDIDVESSEEEMYSFQ